jgi:hypothetical protein
MPRTWSETEERRSSPPENAERMREEMEKEVRERGS